VDFQGEQATEIRNQRSEATEAVETVGMVGPIGIAEVDGALGEGVGSHREPVWMGQIGGGFDDDRGVGGPRDGKTEAVELHAEGGTEIQNCGIGLVPRGRWVPGKGRTPTGCARHKIEDSVVDKQKSIIPKAGGIVPEIDAGQAVATLECLLSDVLELDAVAEGDIGQAGADSKSLVRKDADTVGDHDAGMRRWLERNPELVRICFWFSNVQNCRPAVIMWQWR
jgi:hypothetical protein